MSAFHAEHRESIEMLLRLVVAMLSGMAIGLNRDLYGKPIGMRTLGLVSLSSALAVMSGSAYGHAHFDEQAVSRVIQGILTGIGFLGAGVIIRREDGAEVQGLTTASTVWMAAALGVTAGLGAWFITIAGNGLALGLLVFGKPVERRLNSFFGGRKENAD
ncbi:MAG TPA: MgtC/SapB family protein, partial [Microvirga sp.]|nr:MgtC/SapB family protein [Microvirga sp.]